MNENVQIGDYGIKKFDVLRLTSNRMELTLKLVYVYSADRLFCIYYHIKN